MDLEGRDLKLRMQGADVRQLQTDLRTLGATISDRDGFFGQTTRRAVIEFQRVHGLSETGVVDIPFRGQINAALPTAPTHPTTPGELPPGAPEPVPVPVPIPEPPGDGKQFVVEGEVVRPDGTPLVAYPVRAYDRALCTWRELVDTRVNQVRTDQAGRYVIAYDRSQLEAWGKTRADLKVEVRDAETAQTVLAESPLILRALPHETVNLSVGQQRYRGPDEYSRVRRALAPLLDSHGNDLSCLEVADVLILAREAHLASSTVAFYVKAQRWAAEFGAPPALFYALMRRGEPTRIDALLARPLARLWAQLEEAKSRNLVNLPLDETTRTQLAQLQQTYLARPENPYAHLMGTTTLNGEQSVAFTRRLTAGGQSGDAFWQALESEDGFSAETVADLQSAFELQSFTGENTTLTVRLRGDLAVRAPREVAAFSVEHWRDTVLKSAAVDIPEEVLPGGTAGERREAYARLLYRAAEQAYPTPALAAQLARDPLPGQDTLPRFFSANPDFEFRDQRVLTFLRERPQALRGLPETARDDVLRLEQLFHLVALDQDKLATIEPMWRAGLRSAPQVAYLGRSNLMRRVGPVLDARTANRIYRKAVHVTSLALSVYLRFHPGLNRLSLAALQLPQPPSAVPASQALAVAAITMPEWEELFGSPDACVCSPCESTLSPAAYLVDSLAYLEKAVDANGNNALDELLARRPDLGSLLLTCENTETPLPHIDLVVEILEAIVASADGKTLSGAAIGETTWDSELLGAQPQYLKPAAYDVVRASSYPFDRLPFDLWAEEGRRYLKQMGVARHELMKTMPAKPGAGALQIATEALGMSSVERDLIRQSTTRPEEMASRWGIDLANGTLGAQLGFVEALLEQAHIDHDTLLRLLNTRYINPGRLISVSFAGTPCAVDGAVLVGEGGVALVEEPFRMLLDRLHRFLRVKRRLDCSEYDLDGVLHALGVADFDATGFFSKLADVQTLRQTLGLSLPELGALWADLDTYAFDDEQPSRYDAIYLNEALFPDTHTGAGPDLRNAVFALRADRADLAITTSVDTSLSPWLAESDGAVPPICTLQPDYAVYIQSATQLTADDLLLLVQELLPRDSASGHVVLNLANASLVYRVASLARALKVSVRDVLRLVAITGVAPLRTSSEAASPIDTLRFHERFAEIEAGTRSVEQLAYLLLDEPAAVAALAPATADVDAWLESISPSFTGILAIDDARITPELTASLIQSLGSVLAVDPAAFEALLFTQRVALGKELLAHVLVAANIGASGPPIPRREFDIVFRQLHKFGLAWNGLALDLSFLPFVLDQGPGLGWTDIAKLPTAPQTSARFEPWRRLVAAANLQASTFSLEDSLFELLENAAAATAAQASEPTSFVLGDFLAQLSGSTGWPLADVTYLTGANGFNLSLPAAMRDETALIGLERVFALIRATGVAAEQAHAWTIAELTFAETQSIKQTLSLAYEPDQWLEILGAIQDELRTLKRDALLGHALTTLGMEDSDAFYRHYLIDPDESPIDRTSRIVLAHSAVQLFAQRILLNLEPFTFERLDAEAWQWRKRYRVWEAARKVFLWPENWLEPEWRDDKSVFFQELEDGLLQDEVTHARAEELYLQYLHKVDEVSQLEIMGTYCEEETEEQPAKLHVFGRTRDVPHRYFYRRCEDGARWTPWEPVELDINADHLIPVVANGRLFLFWPEFTKADNPNSTTVTTTQVISDPERAGEINREIAAHRRRIDDIDDLLEGGVGDSSEVDGPGNIKNDDATVLMQERLDHELAIELLEAELADLLVEQERLVYGDRYLMEIGMKWSDYRAGRWRGAIASKDKLSYSTSDGESRHYFTGWVDVDNVLRISARINKYWAEGVGSAHAPEGYLGYFYFDECGGNLVASSVDVTDPIGEVTVPVPMQSHHSVGWYLDSLELQVGDAAAKRLLLSTMRGTLHYAHQYGQYGAVDSPFFLADGVRTYFVRPEEYLSMAGSTWSSTATGRVAAGTARRASSVRVVGPGRAAAPGVLSLAAPAQHFASSDANMILDRGATQLASTTMAGTVGALIEADPLPTTVAGTSVVVPGTRYRFTRFYHPHTCLLLKQHYRYGVDGLLNPDPTWGTESAALYRQLLPAQTFDFEDVYTPNRGWVADNFNSDQVGEQFDFDPWSPYGNYNLELFFHIPLLVATRLMQNQRYAEARRWFHYIFDPTSTDGVGTERFWKIKPFYQEQLDGPLESLQVLLTEGSSAYEQQVREWELDPFNPYVIARLRISAYMQAVVMRYLTSLLDEADGLFRRDTREDINEARQLYLLAAEILGDRPSLLPAQEASPSTPNLLLKRFKIDWNGPLGRDPLDWLTSRLPVGLPGTSSTRPSARMMSGSNAVDASVVSPAPGSLMPSAPSGLFTVSAQGGASGVDTLLLFCIPHNEMLYDFWDKVADRLFKIRHSMNLSGHVRQLALFAPPIDPGLLVRAIAAGLSIESILSGLFAPRSCYRFSFMLQKALELCGEARSLGAAMLAALEKQDGEQIALLRSTHEVGLLESIRALKKRSIEEAEASLAGLVKSRESAEFRAAHYSSLERTSAGEQKSQQKQEDSRHWQAAAEGAEVLASVFHVIPTATSTGPHFGGPHLGAGAQAIAGSLRARSAFLAYAANKASIAAGYSRRFKDWKLQVDLAKKEVEQLEQQILAAEIRKQIAESDAANHEAQTTRAQEVEDFLKLKFTSQQLYSWMVSKLASVHFQVYQMAYQLALQTQAAFLHELGPDEQQMSFIEPDNWDSLKKGLLAGELLYLQLRQMEAAHIAANKRELEITKPVSLFQLDPAQLLKLRRTGACDIHIPEGLYALDFPSHYFRRIKAIRITIPGVAGPYTNVSATLRLMQSWTRRQIPTDMTVAPDVDVTILPQTAIATCTGSGDSGTFELSFNDLRYLPFEGAGAISTWHLELPSTLRPFDYRTIADVVMHVSYTARDGEDVLKEMVNAGLPAALNDWQPLISSDVTQSRLFSLRHDFPDEWHALTHPTEGQVQSVTLKLGKQHFPRYLDFLWSSNGNGPVARSISLSFSGGAADVILAPNGLLPAETDTPALAVSGLSDISNDAEANVVISVSGVLDAASWRDLYLLLRYEVVVNP